MIRCVNYDVMIVAGYRVQCVCMTMELDEIS